MAVAVKIHRVANPRRRKAVRRNVRRKTARKTRKNPVIRRYTVKALKSELKRRGKSVNPRRRSKVRRRAVTSKRRSVRRRSNPVLIELGALNPRRSSMAKRKTNGRSRRRRVARRRHTRRNPVAVTRRRRRTANPRRRRYARRSYSRRRNPMGVSANDMVVKGIGGLIGVAATKFLPTLIPASLMTSFAGVPFLSVITTGAGAFAASFLVGKFAGPGWGNAVLIGGLMQTASAALNALAPPSIAGALALSGVGDIIPSGPFPVPSNNLRYLPSAVGVSGIGAGIRRRR